MNKSPGVEDCERGQAMEAGLTDMNLLPGKPGNGLGTVVEFNEYDF